MMHVFMYDGMDKKKYADACKNLNNFVLCMTHIPPSHVFFKPRSPPFPTWGVKNENENENENEMKRNEMHPHTPTSSHLFQIFY